MKRTLFLLISLYMGLVSVNAQEDHCDVNGDGVVNIVDVTYVIDHILGKGHASTPIDEGHEAIDLGLPSGTMWASCNVGATKPEEYGGHYAWGETVEKDYYDWSNYIHCDGDRDTCHDLGSDISGTQYDVAHVKWGDNWCMPTLDDIKELCDHCTSEWTTLNGVNGRKFTGPNGNSIFLPAAGYRSGGYLDWDGSYGYYWSSTQDPGSSEYAYDLVFSLGNSSWNYDCRGGGQSVRPVKKPKISDVPAEAIDLGLPSGTKWASCNVGATNPEEYGECFAWGELEEKSICKETNYIYASGNGEDESGYYVSNRSYRYLGSNIGGTEYDVAHVRWGGNWRMPTQTEISELLNNCTCEWTTLNNVLGRRFTGPNGNSIFLPAAGYVFNKGKRNIGTYGYYWSSTPHSSLSNSAFALLFVSNDVESIHAARATGRSVRPVWKE